jgi:hypothetical protein
VRFFDRAISQRVAVATICFFFSPARHLTRFSGTELLPHRSNEPNELLIVFEADWLAM